MNTWPNNSKRALDQSEHEAWNALNYPGTRQLCILCNGTTERCEEDEIYIGNSGPLCVKCEESTKEINDG